MDPWMVYLKKCKLELKRNIEVSVKSEYDI